MDLIIVILIIISLFCFSLLGKPKEQKEYKKTKIAIHYKGVEYGVIIEWR
jgi:hypothetical protein